MTTNTSIPMVGVGIAMIAEPGDAVLGHVLNSYVGSVGGGYVNAYQQFLIDLEQGGSAIPGIGTSMAESIETGIRERWFPRLRSESAKFAVTRMQQHGIEVMFPDDDKWPVQLDRLGVNRPRVLFLQGDASLLTAERRVGIVGARSSTNYGHHVTLQLAADLVERDYVIVSGGAYGIDENAHRSALASKGKTIAVLAGGLDRYYPDGNRGMFEQIREHGVLVSEVEPGAAPTKWRFLQRNRVIAALSDGIVVVEAGFRSGSLNTVSHASALEMPIGAVPGPITSAASAGCHRAINEFGAKVITSADDIVAMLA